MTPHEVDISWQVLRHIARKWAGSDADVESATPLAGGSISTALSLVLRDGRKAVLKITPHRVDKSYADEIWQLALLKEAGLPVPNVYQHKLGSLEEPYSYLLMEFVEGMDLAETKAACPTEQFEVLQVELAGYVKNLHARTATHFQRAAEGESKQYDKWPQCYRQWFDPIWAEVEKSGGLPIKCRKTVGKIHERLERFISHDDVPRLLHGDLWSSNLLCRKGSDGQWHIAAFLDPHCKYGHAEAELAYLELFRTVTPGFMKIYQQDRKLSQDYYQVRRPIYQLYSILGDLYLFGQEYLKLAITAIEKVGHLV